MSAISLKSITGITSITTPAGVDNQLTLHTNNTTERLRIDSSGNLTISGNSSVRDITYGDGSTTGYFRSTTNVNRSNAEAAIHMQQFKWNNTKVAEIKVITGDDTTNKDNAHIVFETANSGTTAERLRILSNGNVGIGRTDPGEKLDITGTVMASGGFKTAGHPVVTYASFTDISGGSYATRLGSTGTSTLRSTQIYGGGNALATFDGVNYRLGLGITAPEAALHINFHNGHGSVNNTLRFTNTDTDVTSNETTGKIEWETKDSTAAGIHAYLKVLCSNTGYSSMHFGTGNATTLTDRLKITQDGDVNIIDGNLVMASGHGIDFSATGNSSGSMSSELLDDYEEGSWTPVYQNGSGSITVNGSYSMQFGRYVKIGKMVYVEGALRANVSTNTTGTYDIGGLPFTISNDEDSGGVLMCKEQSNWTIAPDHFSPMKNTTAARARAGLNDGAASYTNGNTSHFNSGSTNNNRIYFSGSYMAA